MEMHPLGSLVSFSSMSFMGSKVSGVYIEPGESSKSVLL